MHTPKMIAVGLVVSCTVLLAGSMSRSINPPEKGSANGAGYLGSRFRGVTQLQRYLAADDRGTSQELAGIGATSSPTHGQGGISFRVMPGPPNRGLKLFLSDKYGFKFYFPDELEMRTPGQLYPGAPTDSNAPEFDLVQPGGPDAPKTFADCTDKNKWADEMVVGSVAFYKEGFSAAANDAGFSLSAAGKWTYSDTNSLGPDDANGINGKGWKGIEVWHSERMYPVHCSYLGLGDAVTAVVSPGGKCSLVFDFADESCISPDTILRSLRFFAPTYHNSARRR